MRSRGEAQASLSYDELAAAERAFFAGLPPKPAGLEHVLQGAEQVGSELVRRLEALFKASLPDIDAQVMWF